MALKKENEEQNWTEVKHICLILSHITKKIAGYGRGKL